MKKLVSILLFIGLLTLASLGSGLLFADDPADPLPVDSMHLADDPADPLPVD